MALLPTKGAEKAAVNGDTVDDGDDASGDAADSGGVGSAGVGLLEAVDLAVVVMDFLDVAAVVDFLDAVDDFWNVSKDKISNFPGPFRNFIAESEYVYAQCLTERLNAQCSAHS